MSTLLTLFHRRGRSAVSSVVPAVPWYLKGSVPQANCIGAWRPEQAASLAASYVNLITPGVNDLVALTAPTLDGGWVGDGSAMLRSPIVEKSLWTTIIKFSGVSGATADSAYMYGPYQSGVGIRGIVPVATGSKHNIINGGGTRQVAGVLNTGIIAIAGNSIYLDGFIESTFPSAVDLSVGFGVLGLYNGTVGSNKLNAGKILALATYNATLTTAQIRQIGEGLSQTFTVFTTLGDSITQGASWAATVSTSYVGVGTNVLKNRAVSGNSIMSHMDAQVVAAANDYADIVICALGTNDNNAGDMNALQAEVEENLVELKTNHPRARVFYMNVLPHYTSNAEGAPQVAHGNVRAAIAAACAAQGVTCWDTVTSPWFTSTQTSDGQHPTADGHAAIAAQVLSRI